MKTQSPPFADKQSILVEIRRFAERNGGQAPGQRLFEVETGIARSTWRGKYWATWSDAVLEAGFEPNFAPAKATETDIMELLANAVRHFRRFPSDSELRIFRQSALSAPAIVTIRKQFPTRELMISRLFELAKSSNQYADILEFLPETMANPNSPTGSTGGGWVYLLKSGAHYKVGRSETLERRIKQISVALPEAATMVHAIETDDTIGIERYWHERFAVRRANGEWFKLGPADVSAFKKRKFM